MRDICCHLEDIESTDWKSDFGGFWLMWGNSSSCCQFYLLDIEVIGLRHSLLPINYNYKNRCICVFGIFFLDVATPGSAALSLLLACASKMSFSGATCWDGRALGGNGIKRKLN